MCRVLGLTDIIIIICNNFFLGYLFSLFVRVVSHFVYMLVCFFVVNSGRWDDRWKKNCCVKHCIYYSVCVFNLFCLDLYINRKHYLFGQHVFIFIFSYMFVVWTKKNWLKTNILLFLNLFTILYSTQILEKWCKRVCTYTFEKILLRFFRQKIKYFM